MSNYCDSVSQYFCIIVTSYWELVVFIVCCHFISLYYLPWKVRYFYFKRCRKLCQGLFFHFAKIIIFSENLSFFCCFFSFFAPTFVAFASMILLSYSSFECLPPASFRFHLAVAPLLLAIQFQLLGLVRDLHPLDNAHAERTNKEALSGLPYMESAVCVCMTGCWRIILCCPTARWFLCRKMIFGNSVSLIKSFSIYGSSTII